MCCINAMHFIYHFKRSVHTATLMALKSLLLLLATLISLKSFSQAVEIINQADIKNLPESIKFAFLEAATDTSEIKYVATILARDKNKKSNIEFLYSEIRKQANKLGANCYKLKSFTRGGKRNEAILVLDSYFASDSLLKINTRNHEKNVVFLFGKEREDEKTITFDLNGEEKEIKAGTFYKIFLKEGENIKVSKGGFAGSVMLLIGERDSQPCFYALSGFGLADMSQQSSNSISFNTGGISRIGNISLGLLLTQLLKQAN